MANERHSILCGMKTALRLHRELDLECGADEGRRIDVFGCIDRMEAVLIFRPLDRLLGAFMRQDGVPGIIVNTRRPPGMRRFTAAHELGHLALEHDQGVDGEEMLARGPVANASRVGATSSEEREADAFASYFLLPPRLIKAQMDIQGWEPLSFEKPETVYQASLRFGSSYRAAVYALERDKVIGSATRRRLLKARPGSLKREILGDDAPADLGYADVWLLTERDEGAVIEAGRSDLFVLRLREDGASGYLWAFDELQDAGFAILKDEREPGPVERIGAPTIRRILARTDEALSGTARLRECRPWDPENDPRFLTLHRRTAVGDEAGLFERQREALLAAP